MLALYDSDGSTLLDEDDNGGLNGASRIRFTPSISGTYYVVARQVDGYADPSAAYELLLTEPSTICTDAYDPDDSATITQMITSGTPQAHAFCVDNDEDWTSFSANVGTTYRIETRDLASGLDTVIELYDSDGATLLAQDDDSGEGWASLLKFTPDITGTYYLKIREWGGTGDPSNTYQLRFSDMSAATPDPTSGSCADGYEPDASAAIAQSLALDAIQTHAFCAPGDTDWISVTLDADTTYTARTSNLAHDVDTVLELYASDGVTLLDQNDDSYGDSSSVTFTPAASGIYYIKLHHASATWGDASYSYHITLFEGYGGGGGT